MKVNNTVLTIRFVRWSTPLTVVSILQSMQISNHYVIYLELILYANYTSIIKNIFIKSKK